MLTADYAALAGGWCAFVKGTSSYSILFTILVLSFSFGKLVFSMRPTNTMDSCQIFLFGDLTIPFEEDLRQLLHTKGNGSLSFFLDQIGFAFREEFGKLASRQQCLLPRFTTLIDLLFKLEESEGAPALKFALLCVYQIGQFIRYELQDHLPFSQPQADWNHPDTMEKGQDPFLVLTTATWWEYAQVRLLPLPSARLEHSPSWFPRVLKQLWQPSGLVFAR